MDFKVLIVDDEMENLKALERSLRKYFSADYCLSPLEALEKLKKHTYGAILTDQRMPGMTGTELLTEATKHSPETLRILLTAYPDTREIIEAVNRAEIFRYLLKPWNEEELISALRLAEEHYKLRKENRVLVDQLTQLNSSLEQQVADRTHQLIEANRELERLSLTDPLTMVLNRRGLFQKLETEFARIHRYQRPLAILMIDVDHFKTYNDTEGHPAGDKALKAIAETLKKTLRRIDILGRYGGEEFCIALPETSRLGAKEISERLRQAVERETPLTISIGVSFFPDTATTLDQLIEQADQSLKEGKAQGRNRVIFK